jgi:hypothetical protein
MIGGWRIRSLFVGPFRVMRHQGRLRLCLHRIFAVYGGVVLVTPEQWEPWRVHRRNRIRLVAGGPVASFSLALIAMVALLVGGFTAYDVLHVALPEALGFTAVTSFGIGLVTLIPLPMGGGMLSDGLQLLRLLRARGEESDPNGRLLYICARRPRDWPRELLANPALLPAKQRTILEYYQVLDCGDPRSARERLQQSLELAASGSTPGAQRERAALAVEAAIFEGIRRGDADAALRWRQLGEAVRDADPARSCSCRCRDCRAAREFARCHRRNAGC